MPDSPDINDELLSAYFDNELSPELRKKMGAALSADPQLRKTLEDFDFLHEELQALPVVFHQDQEQMLEDVITRIRDANLSAQAPSVHRKQPLPTPDRSWQQKVRFPVLLTLTAAILAMVTMPYFNEPDDTALVQTDTSSQESPANEPAKRMRQTEMKSANELAEAEMDGAMADSAAPTAEAEALASTLDRSARRDGLSENNAPGVARSADAPRPASPQEHPELENQANASPSKMQTLSLAPVAYHIQVQQQHFDALIRLLAMDPARHLVDNSDPSGAAAGLGGGSGFRAEGKVENAKPAASGEGNKLNDRLGKTLTQDQVFVVQGSSQQITKLLSIINKHPSFALSQQVVQSNLRKRVPLRESPNADQDARQLNEALKDKNISAASTIFTIRIVPTVVPADAPK